MTHKRVETLTKGDVLVLEGSTIDVEAVEVEGDTANVEGLWKAVWGQEHTVLPYQVGTDVEVTE